VSNVPKVSKTRSLHTSCSQPPHPHQVIQALVGQGVKRVCCGKSHTLALTETLEVSSRDSCPAVTLIALV
jgi:alpha-tubulin suppressor-like RCC1 family protein